MSDKPTKENAIPARHGQGWTADEERRLYDAYLEGTRVVDIADEHERTAGGIRSALKRMGLMDEDGQKVEPPPPFDASAAAVKRDTKAATKAAKRAALPAEPDLPTPDMNASFREAIRLMEDTSDNLFITGRAGTGKSTLLSYFCRTTDKQPVVLAPTGVAALNVKGQTIHRFFNFPVDVTPDKIRHKNTKPRNTKLYKKLQTIIIDEISMVRADIMDCIDAFLRMYGPKTHEPFGGVQMIFVGDLYQLPPVITRGEQEAFSTLYETPYFFSSHVMEDANLKILELEQVYRQKDQTFVDILNKIRNNSAETTDIARLNQQVGAPAPAGKDAFEITLTTTNAIADTINEEHLAALPGRVMTATATVSGDFAKEYYPTAPELQYKIGAQIMLLNNDTEQRWVNGSIGVIVDNNWDEAGDAYLLVKLQDGGNTVSVYPYSWEVYRYEFDAEAPVEKTDDTSSKKKTGAIVSTPVGTFTQYPFRLAWGITIHKSQGKTFDRVVIDLGRGAFAAGQLYVALSRCTSLGGITLKSPIRSNDIRTDPRIVTYLQHDIAMLDAAQAGLVTIIRQAIQQRLPLDITYLKADNTEIEQTVQPISVAARTYNGETYHGMKAIDLAGNIERLFRIDRILQIGKPIQVKTA